MYARVVRFTDVDPDQLAGRLDEVDAREGPPMDIPANLDCRCTLSTRFVSGVGWLGGGKAVGESAAVPPGDFDRAVVVVGVEQDGGVSAWAQADVDAGVADL